MADVSPVQCQRTRRFIPASTVAAPTLVCPWCDEHETYQRLDQRHEAWHHVKMATHMCRAEFDVADDGRQAAVWLGDSPETVFEEHLDRHNIYLGRASDRWQLMYSGSHEAFHRVCGERKNRPHWADEMFAVLFSLLYLERIGEVAHAARNRAELTEDASQLSRQEMFEITENPLPDGLYGRAYLVGEELLHATDWDHLKPLAVLRTQEGFPDMDKWLELLSPAKREKVLSILQA